MNTLAPNALEIVEVVQAYGRRRVLDGTTLRVPEGATTVLLGENGEGKTTLLRLCLGVLKPKAGTVRVLGLDPLRHPARVRRAVGFVPDKPDVYPWMKVPDLFRFLAAHYPTWSASRAAQVVEALDVPLDRTFKQMSRGEGMKAMLAAALAPDPDVLLLDEPFAGLDPLVREDVLRQVITAVGDRPRTVLCITHDLDVAARLADRIAVLSHGKVVREGPASDFGATPEDAITPHALRQAIALAAGLATVGGR